MPLTRNEKIAIGLGIVGAAGVGILLELLERHAGGIRSFEFGYAGDGTPSRVIGIPFNPAIVYIVNTGRVGTQTPDLWLASPNMDLADNIGGFNGGTGNSLAVSNPNYPFVLNGFDVGKAFSYNGGTFDNALAEQYRLIAYG